MEAGYHFKNRACLKSARYRFAICILLSCTLFFGCDNEKEVDEDKYPLLEGIWSSDPSGIASRINIYQGAATFLSFSQDQWKGFSDAGYIKAWDSYFYSIQYKGKGEFDCQSFIFKGSAPVGTVAILNLATDAKSFKIKTGNDEVFWYKQSDNPIKRGFISFWTAKNWGNGSIHIELYDNSYNFDYYPLDEDGYLDVPKYEKYKSDHFIDYRILSSYVTSGVPGCANVGLSASIFFVPYGSYKYAATDGKNRWFGSIYLSVECLPTEIK